MKSSWRSSRDDPISNRRIPTARPPRGRGSLTRPTTRRRTGRDGGTSGGDEGITHRTGLVGALHHREGANETTSIVIEPRKEQPGKGTACNVQAEVPRARDPLGDIELVADGQSPLFDPFRSVRDRGERWKQHPIEQRRQLVLRAVRGKHLA